MTRRKQKTISERVTPYSFLQFFLTSEIAEKRPQTNFIKRANYILIYVMIKTENSYKLPFHESKETLRRWQST